MHIGSDFHSCYCIRWGKIRNKISDMAINEKQGDDKISHFFIFLGFARLMAHNAIKSDCHYLQIDLAGLWGLFNEKCSLTVGWLCLYNIMLDILQLWCIYLFYRSSPLAVCLSHPHFYFNLFVVALFVSVSATLCASVCLSASSQSLCLPGPVGRFMTGVALVKPSSGIKWQRVRQALSHYAGPPILALIESSDPKLMGRGAGAHLLSTVDVLKRQTGEQQWQCWICSVDSDTLLLTLAHLLISHSGFAVVSKGPGLCSRCRCEPVVQRIKHQPSSVQSLMVFLLNWSYYVVLAV